MFSLAPASVIILSWLSDLGYLISVILSSFYAIGFLPSHGPLGPAPGRLVDGGPETQGWKLVTEKKFTASSALSDPVVRYKAACPFSFCRQARPFPVPQPRCSYGFCHLFRWAYRILIGVFSPSIVLVASH